MQAHDIARLTANFREVQFNFVTSELDLSITFSNVALNATNPEIAARNRVNARRALQSAQQSLRKARLDPAEKAFIVDKMKELKTLMRELRRQEMETA